MTEISRAKKKLVAIERAKRRLQTRLEDIDWEEAVLAPKLEAFAAAATAGELPSTTLVKNEASDDQPEL